MDDSKELMPVRAGAVRRNYAYEETPEYFAQQPRLRDYWEIIFKRRWGILTLVLVAAVLTLVGSLRTTPIYRASARLEVQPEAHPTAQLQFVEDAEYSDITFLQTQVQVLSSDNLAWTTIESLGLDRDPRFGGSITAADPDRRKSLLIGSFKGRMKAELVRDSRMIELSFEDSVPALAAAAVNALARNYVEYNFQKQFRSTAQATEWMTRELDTLKAKVENSQQALVSYESANAAINIDDKQNITLQKLSELTRQLTEAQGDRIQKEEFHRMATGKERIPAALQSELLSRLRDRQSELRDQYAGAKSQFGANWPSVMALKNRLDESTHAIEQEESRVVTKLRSDFLTAANREGALKKAVEDQKQEATRLNQLGIQYAMLKKEAEANQNLYNMLLQRMKEAGVTAGMRASNIHIVDQALPPLSPFAPQPTRNVALSIVIALIIGITAAFVKEYMDNTVCTPDQVERMTGGPALAVIPMNAGRIRSKQDRKHPAGSNGKGHTQLVMKESDTPYAEAIRRLRTSFLLALFPDPPRVVLVTSGMPQEGKTTTAVNLALALSQQGLRVLLIDADLRRPSVHAALKIENLYGLSTVLADGKRVPPTRLPNEPNLAVLTAGGPVSNPADLLASPMMGDLLRTWRTEFDHILIDTPPLFHFTDAIVLGGLVDGVLLVAQAGVTAADVLKRSARMLADGRCRVLGTVLNMVNFRSNPHYYSPYYGGHYKSYYQRKGKPASA